MQTEHLTLLPGDKWDSGVLEPQVEGNEGESQQDDCDGENEECLPPRPILSCPEVEREQEGGGDEEMPD